MKFMDIPKQDSALLDHSDPAVSIITLQLEAMVAAIASAAPTTVREHLINVVQEQIGPRILFLWIGVGGVDIQRVMMDPGASPQAKREAAQAAATFQINLTSRYGAEIEMVICKAMSAIMN